MDNRAYRRAVEDYGDMVWRIALNQTRSAADADDITEQVKQNGAATGTFQKDGTTYVYQVTGESGNWHVSVDEQ